MRRRAGVLLCWLPVCLLIAAVMRPVITQWSEVVLGPFGGIDAVLQAGLLEWTGRHCWQPAIWVDIPIFYPASQTLAFMDSLLGQALLVLPCRLLPGATPAGLYNIVFLVSLVLAAGGFALLWRLGGGDWSGGGFGALCLLGSPYALSQLGHLNQLPPWPLLLGLAALWFALRQVVDNTRVERGTGRVTCAWWSWGGLLVVQAAWGWYGFAQFVTASVLLLVWGGWRAFGRQRIRRLLLAACGPGLLAVAGVMLLAIPYLQASRHHHEFERSQGEVRLFSADLNHFLNGGAYRLDWQDIRGEGQVGAARYEQRPRQVLFPGFLVFGAAMAGFLLRRHLPEARRRDGWLLLGIGGVGLIFAFGDSVAIPGSGTRILLPFGVLQDLVPPLRALRAATRFYFLVTIALAWWAAVGFEQLMRSGSTRIRRVLPACLLATAVLVESLPAGMTAVRLPDVDPARDPLVDSPSGPVLTLPAPPDEFAEDLREVSWLFRVLHHGHPVTGGVSGWVPHATRDLRQVLAACEAGETEPVRLLADLRADGIELVELALVPAAVSGDLVYPETLGSPDTLAGSQDINQDSRLEFWRQVLTQAGYTEQPSVPGHLLYTFQQERERP
ncbi:MAG: hypothetical protein ABIF77_15075 [bacterium]